MSRGRVAMMILVSTLLLVDSPVVSLGAGSTPPGYERLAVTPAGVARFFGEVNPNLSERELDRIGKAVVRFSRKYDLDPTLVTAVIHVESSARPWALSPKGAVGLMQVMPYVAQPLGLVGNLATIESNVEAGCVILASNISRLGEEDGISAYFWGSNIRGVAYLDRVRAARDEVRRQLRS